MALSDIRFIEQQAYSFLDNFGATLDYLQKQYEATGNEEFLKCRDRMIARYQQSKFFGNPASENNGEYDGGQTLVGPPEIIEQSFTDRVKAIIRKAAEKNGQRIETNTRGWAGTYTLYINDDVFCKAVDKIVRDHKKELKEYLGGKMMNTQVSKVCQFIGYVIRLQIINDANLQLSDLLFAFTNYYKNADTVKNKLSNKKLSAQEEDFFLIVKNDFTVTKNLNNPE